MAAVVLKQLVKKFGSVTAVDHINLTVNDKEFLVLVGPSGCGKTTTLNMVAGLEDISDGEIYIGGRKVNKILPKDRDIAMVFQNYALYPHMNVFKNMAFGLKLRKFPKAEIEKRVKESAEILGIEDLLKRKPRELSGGQRQRVAMGRAIVRKPQVFLFDEPLSNLDAKLRVQMRGELAKLHHRLETTIIYVTHDQVEAMTLADRIVVMNRGSIMQVGKPLEVYNNPRNHFVAGFIGSPSMNFLNIHIVEENGSLYAEGENIRLMIPEKNKARYFSLKNKDAILGIRPEHIHKKDPQSVIPSGQPLQAFVDVLEPVGSELIVLASCGGEQVTARMAPDAEIEAHTQVEFLVDMDKIHIIDKTSKEVI